MKPEELFARYFLPLYPPDSRADLARARATDANPGRNAALFAHLDEAADRFVANAPVLFGVDLALDRSDASVHRLSAALTLERRDRWAAQGAAGTPDSALFNVVVHGAAYVGACVVARHGGVWSVRRPLWESLVRLKSHAGEADLAIFHWWLKSLADDVLGAPAGGAGHDRRHAGRDGRNARRSLPRPRRGAVHASRRAARVRRPRRARSRGCRSPPTICCTSTFARTCRSCAISASTSPRPIASRPSPSGGSTSTSSAEVAWSCLRAPRRRGCTCSGSARGASRRARSSPATRSPTRSCASTKAASAR